MEPVDTKKTHFGGRKLSERRLPLLLLEFNNPSLTYFSN
jgi:hypothetical protein